MNAAKINSGDVLKIKRDRADAYGKDYPFAVVDELVYRGHYKTPWIRCGSEFFRPSDFERHAECPKSVRQYLAIR